MLNVDLCLGLYGLGAAFIAPRLLQRPGLTDRTPLLGVAAWLVAAVTVVGSWLTAAMSLATHSEPLARILGALGVCGVLVSIGWASANTLYATRKRRARHVQAARVLGRPDPSLGALIVESTALAAYCMPHTGGGLVVVTTAAQSRLSHQQLRAVLAHEHEHLHGRHHSLLAVAQVLGRTLPWMRLCRRLVPEIARLLEMQADDVAARRYGASTVATAIAAMGNRTAPAATMGAGGYSAARATRLIHNVTAAPSSRLRLAILTGILVVGPFLATVPPCPHPW